MSLLPLYQHYASIETTIVTGASSIVPLTPVTLAYDVDIQNDNTASGEDLTVNLVIGNNADYGHDITVKAGESRRLNGMQIKFIKLTNTSGKTISYRILTVGN